VHVNRRLTIRRRREDLALRGGDGGVAGDEHGVHAADEEVAKKIDYAEHSPRIEAAIAKLKELAK
jgi:hypothetical protein